jgi:hypothetical protein
MGQAGAVPLDLTGGTTSGFINSALFIRTDDQSTGTGVIEPFVRLGGQGSGTIVQGYNADSQSGTVPVMPDVKAGAWTHDIQLSAIPLVRLHGVLYREFTLDINQAGASLLSLDTVRVYTRATPLSDASSTTLLANNATLRYDMDAGDPLNVIYLKSSINNGSGSGDMRAYIPASAFGSAADFVYLYSMFGAVGGNYEENDGFEEWAVRLNVPPPTDVPDGGATIGFLGLALVGLGCYRWFGKKTI